MFKKKKKKDCPEEHPEYLLKTVKNNTAMTVINNICNKSNKTARNNICKKTVTKIHVINSKEQCMFKKKRDVKEQYTLHSEEQYI